MTLTGALLEALRAVEEAANMRPQLTVCLDSEALRHVKRQITREMRGTVNYDEYDCGGRGDQSFEFAGVRFVAMETVAAKAVPWGFDLRPGAVNWIDGAPTA